MSTLPVRELFFAPLEVSLNHTDLARVRFAYGLSKYAHRGQVREGGERYFNHPKAVSWITMVEFNCTDPRLIIDELLHDVREDSYMLTIPWITHIFGRDIALDISALTKLSKGKESTEAYLKRIVTQGAYAIMAKLVDRLHNLRTLGVCSLDKQHKQILETEGYHLPMLIPALSILGEPWEGYAHVLQDKIEAALWALRDNA